MATLTLTFLGSFQAAIDGISLTRFRSDKVRALLAYLAVESDRPHARASLCGLLWPDQPDDAALHNLSQTLLRLHEALGGTRDTQSFLRVSRQAIQWNVASDYRLDAADFVRLASSTNRADLEQALALYRGEFLPGFSLPGCAAFEEWLLLVRERLRRNALMALDTLTRIHLASGRYDQAEQYARRQIVLDSWREEAYRQLMRALAAAGNRAAALTAYERCRELLRIELGVEPDAQTTALVDEIRAMPLGASAVSSVGRAALPAEQHKTQHWNTVPGSLTPFFGREQELEQLADLLRHSGERLVTLIGEGGVGKTRLALATAGALRSSFADGIVWVALAGVGGADLAAAPDPETTAAQIADAVAVALGLTSAGAGDAAGLCLGYLRQKELLLVLDNVEHLLAGACFVLDLLGAAPRVHMLVTSRERLNVRAEYTLRLAGLPVPATNAHDDPASYSSVQLFLDHAARARRDFRSDPDTLRAVAGLCRLLEGLPLGIELAAHWAAHYEVDEIAAAIREDLDFLTTSARDYPERHRSLRAAFGYSWQRLNADERRVLARLSVFRGVFSRAAALEIAETRVAALATLVDKSLLRQAGIGNYALHELLRQMAAEQLAAMEPEQTTQERHSRYYLALVARHEAALLGPEPRPAVAAIHGVIDNVRQAWQWAVAQQRWAWLEQSMCGLALYYRITGLIHEAAQLFEAAIAQARSGEAAHPHKSFRGATASRLLGLQAHFLFRQARYDEGIAAARAAVAYAQVAGDSASEAIGYLQSGSIALPHLPTMLTSAEEASAHRYLERAIALCRAVPINDGLLHQSRIRTIEAESLRALAMLMISEERYDQAIRLSEEALQICRAIGNRFSEGLALIAYAEALEQAGWYEPARIHREATLQLYRAVESVERESVALNNLAGALIYLGDYATAAEYAQQAVQISQHLGLDIAPHIHTLSWATYHLEAYEAALEYGRQALRASEREGTLRSYSSFPLLAIGDALGGLGQWDAACSSYGEVIALAHESNARQIEIGAQAGLAHALLAMGQTAEALAHVEVILKFLASHALNSVLEPLRIYLICYRVLRAAGDRRAPVVLQTAHAILQEQAERIVDAAWRRSFLEHVAAHREIRSAFATLQ